MKFNDFEWSLWDRIEIDGDITLKEFIYHFEDKFGLVVNMIGLELVTLYSSFLSKNTLSVRLQMK